MNSIATTIWLLVCVDERSGEGAGCLRLVGVWDKAQNGQCGPGESSVGVGGWSAETAGSVLGSGPTCEWNLGRRGLSFTRLGLAEQVGRHGRPCETQQHLQLGDIALPHLEHHPEEHRACTFRRLLEG